MPRLRKLSPAQQRERIRKRVIDFRNRIRNKKLLAQQRRDQKYREVQVKYETDYLQLEHVYAADYLQRKHVQGNKDVEVSLPAVYSRERRPPSRSDPHMRAIEESQNTTDHMITIDLEENENDDVIEIPDNPENSEETPNDKHFKKKLITQVCKHRSLYDNKHKLFSNVAKKDLVWQQIANKLKSDVDTCKETWFELRYNYQRHARKLRNFFLQGRKGNRKRPAMAFESELMFLWRVTDNRKSCEIQFEIPEDGDTQAETEQDAIEVIEITTPTEEIQKQIDDDLIIVESPVELIVIDEDDDNTKTIKPFILNSSMKKLISLIKTHPEIYDTKHKDFRNYTRKSFLWNAIAGNMADKATKLMKSWIVMQTRYEWEINQPNQAVESDLQVELKPFKEFILENQVTVYKQSHFLRKAWQEPIDYFKDIYNLIVRMKKMAEIVYVTDSLLQTSEKSKQYLNLWSDIAGVKNTTAGQCEATWLIMRFFYWELMSMRQENYQLTDKWYFETIITELYAISKSAQLANKKQEHQAVKSNRPNKNPTKRPSQTNATSQGAPANKVSSSSDVPVTSSTPVAPVILNNYLNTPTISSTNSNTIQPTAPPTLTLPKITAAISLAPQSLNSGSLQIKQISGPPALSPAPFQLNNGTSTSVTLPTTTAVTTQMSTLSFNLPTQTRVTPVTMPSLIRPIIPNSSTPAMVRSTTATISVRPQSQLKPQIQIASWATAPKPAVNSTNVVTKIHNNLLPTLPNTFPAPQMQTNLQTPSVHPPPLMTFNQQNAPLRTYRNKQTSLITPVNSSQRSLASIKMTGIPTNTTLTPPITPLTTNNNINNNINTFTMAPTDTNTDPNNSAQLPKISGAVSLLNPNEILIELIASQNGNLLVVHGPPLTAKYQLTMQMVAKFIREVLAIPMLHSKQNVQHSLINYYWDHVSNTFNLPVHICRAIWNFLLENFDHFPRIAPMKELMKPFHSNLKVWVESHELFQKFDDMCLFKDWVKYAKSFPDVVECIGGYPVLYKEKKSDTDMEVLCAFRTIGLRFPQNPNIQKIWNALKNSFVKYMKDLEIGIDNKWSATWWRSLARMKFLVEAKYPTSDPYFYIVSNKMVEEIDRFVSIEMKIRSTKVEETSRDCTEDGNNIEMAIMASVIPSNEKMKEVEIITLLTAIQKYPIIYTTADTIEKHEAWEKVAQELGMEVTTCLLAFKSAIEKYLAYKKQDPVNRLYINGKYYKKIEELIHSQPFSKLSSAIPAKINIKTPFELNQSVDTDNSADLVFPERFISDINMSNSPSDLVVKNWIYAIGNISNFSESASSKLAAILKKYIPDIQ